MWCSLLILYTAAVYAEATDSETVVGIDLGATNSYIAAVRNGQAEIIVDEHGNPTTPSIVAFIDGEIITGETAIKHSINNPENTVFNVKKLLGKEWSETIEDVQKVPYKVIEKNGKPHVFIEDAGVLSPEEITAIIIKKMKDSAEAIGKVSYAVVSVPTHFNEAQRRATKEACEIGGLKILRLITDPIAAAVAYGFDEAEGERNILVFDIGGNALDVSILNIDNGVIQILATSENTHLGGDKFDQRVLEYFKQMYKERGVDIKSDGKALRELRCEVEKAKKTLSTDDSVKVEIKPFFNGKHLSEILTRDKFEELNIDLFKSTLTSVEEALKDAEMSIDDIDEIILVGGSTNIPKIQQLLREFFGKELYKSIEPDEVVAYGAAVFADKVTKEPEPPVCISMNPLTIGIETKGRIMTKLIPRNTIIPTKKKQTFSTAYDNQLTATIKIYEGESLMTKHNNLIGKFDLVINPGPKSKQIEVTLEIDANEVLVVTAEEKQTGAKEEIIIQNNTDRWTAGYIEEMKLNAAIFAADDEKARESVENSELLLEGHRDVEFEELKELINVRNRRKIDEL